ncbi:5-hydroxytryptamine receptor-like [Ostrea edulis]|uniref:5-hydroxytryptamine receptor-like n=1 Tax=Ostrea edulis TaxID=37623 RepID=UPI002095EA72|nr:5-hydroxytryptamine receptor-like [Ostrea edulis]
MSSPEFSADEILEEWNDSLTTRLIPNDVILGLYFVIGVVGNAIVLCVYSLRFRGQHGERYFVPFLALADLLACITCVIFTFYLNLHQADFSNETFCKVMWPLATGTTLMSVFLLLVITIERYFKVCRPFHDFKHKRLLLSIIVVMSVALAAPSPFFFGKRATFIPERNLTRYRCTVIRDINSPGPNIYGFVLAIFSILTPVTIAAVYLRIGWKLKGQLKFRQQFISARSTPQLSKRAFAKSTDSCDVLCLEQQHPGTHVKRIKREIIYNQERSNSTECSDNDERQITNKEQSREKQNEEVLKLSNKKISSSNEINEASTEKEYVTTGCAEKGFRDEAHNFPIDPEFIFKTGEVRLSKLKQDTPSHSMDDRLHKSGSRVHKLSTTLPDSFSNPHHVQENCLDLCACKNMERVCKPDSSNLLGNCRKNHCSDVCNSRKSDNTHTVCYCNPCFNASDKRGRYLPEHSVRRHVTSHNGHLYPSLGMHRFTVMFMLIIGICCICYLPKITLLILESVMTSFWASIPDQYLGFVLFLYRFYIFNNVCNPVIYCLFDHRFRREIKFLCCRKRAVY